MPKPRTPRRACAADPSPKAWVDVCSAPFSGRKAKPRHEGLTMLIDKGLGLLHTGDLLDIGGDYIDFIKLAFGTSAFYDRRLLRDKIGLAVARGVEMYPGGTFLEVALAQGRLEEFLREAEDLGFSLLEVSDGTIPMGIDLRRQVIDRVRDAGFRVLTEVGKKHPADRVPGSNIRDLIEADLAEGAYKVIVEGRESGKGVVIYREDGSIDEDELEQVARSVPDPGMLIWEAPLKEQQQDLILRFGPNVNLGNVPPADVLALEALRLGFRGDTLRAALLSNPGRFPVLAGQDAAIDGGKT